MSKTVDERDRFVELRPACAGVARCDVFEPGRHAAEEDEAVRGRQDLRELRGRLPVGRPRTRSGAVAAGKAYSSRANRAHLRNTASRRLSRRRRAAGGRPSLSTPVFTVIATPSSG